MQKTNKHEIGIGDIIYDKHIIIIIIAKSKSVS